MKPKEQSIFLNIGTIIAILGFTVGAVAAIIASPIIGSIFTLFFIIVFGLAFGLPFLRERKKKKLLATGKTAKGKIVEMWDTGTTINNQPQIGITIQITPDFEPAFTATVVQLISRLQTSLYQVGTPCVVKYDPNNKKTVAIETIGDDN